MIYQTGNKNLLSNYGINDPLDDLHQANYNKYKGVKNMKNDEKANKPHKKFKAGCMTATIWMNTIKDKKTDKKIDIYSTVLEKSYMDKDQEWKKTTNIGINDLPKAIVVMQEAYKHLIVKVYDDKEDDD